MTDNSLANERAIKAAGSTEELDRFLAEEQQHILKLTGKVVNRSITISDEEYSVALTAVSEAVRTYDGTKGDFWSYAAFVIKSREIDLYRKNEKTGEHEISVKPEVFGSDGIEDESDASMQRDINEKVAVFTDSGLKDEIEALREKLAEYDISYFDLVNCSPKAEKSKKACSEVLKAIFSPPPLIEEIITGKLLPVKKILERQKISRKLIDRHRKYLISASLILSGDYPEIAEYIPFDPRKDTETGND